jgi:HB1, ASXL, restriction endonuclease HTH domain/Restriction endonuclease
MTFTEAAAEVLRLAGKPLHYKEITELAIEKNLLSHVGKSPEVTMGARLAALLKKEDKTNPIVRVKPGVFALREWSEKKGRKSRSAEEPAPTDSDAGESPSDAEGEEDTGGVEVNALEVEAATRGSERGRNRDDEEDEPRAPLADDDARLVDLAQSGAELFDDEEDDDQPILPLPGTSGQSGHAGQAGQAGQGQGGQGQLAGGDATAEGGRRRRRRRRRGRGDRGPNDFANDRTSQPRLAGISDGPAVPQSTRGEGAIQPTAIISVDGEIPIDGSRDPLAPAPRAVVRDRQQIMAGGLPSGIDVPLGEGEELAGKDLADATLMVMTAFDRAAGPIPLRAIADQLARRGRLVGDPQAAVIQLSASLRADNLRRLASSQRPRFRFANGGRVAPTDWALGPDLARLEQEVSSAIERYREASRRTMLRRIQELPGHAFLELALLGLERIGMAQIKAVRRAGSPGGEAHFSAVHRTGSDEIRTGIVIRKDGREIGRERVSDIRGALHHYGSANSGWLVTTGQVLSGAREEAAALGAAPVALYDGLAFCKLLEDNDVGVVRTRFHVAIPDLELLEAIRG